MRERLKERLQAKLRSGRGASITFALLLFLVCAVVGSVVLAAGTAASGRVSQLAESDRRYYAVTSAAQLLKEKIPEEKLTIKRTKRIDCTVTTTNWILEADEGNSYCTTSDYVLDSTVYDFVPPGTTIDFLKKAAYFYLFGSETVDESDEEALWIMKRDPADNTSLNGIPAMTMELFNGDAAVDGAVPVKVETTVEKNGDLSFKLTAGEEGEAYSVQVAFTLVHESRYDNDPAVPDSDTWPGGEWQDTGFTYESFSVTAEKTDVIHWEFKSMTKGS